MDQNALTDFSQIPFSRKPMGNMTSSWPCSSSQHPSVWSSSQPSGSVAHQSGSRAQYFLAVGLGGRRGGGTFGGVGGSRRHARSSIQRGGGDSVAWWQVAGQIQCWSSPPAIGSRRCRRRRLGRCIGLATSHKVVERDGDDDGSSTVGVVVTS